MATIDLAEVWHRRSGLLAEGDKLYAEGEKLYAEGDALWAQAVIDVHGARTTMQWKDDAGIDRCVLGNGEVYRRVIE